MSMSTNHAAGAPSASGTASSPPAVAPERGISALTLSIVVALASGFIAVGAWASYWAAHRNDQYQLLMLGQCVRDGGRLYLDCWENKPPGIAWINALALTVSFGGQLGCWLLPPITLAVCLALFYWATERLLSPVSAATTTLLAAVVYSARPYDTPSINPDFYSSVLELGAASLFLAAAYARGLGPSIWLSSFAGLVWAAAACVKPTGGAGLLGASVVALWLLRSEGAVRGSWPGCAACAWIGFSAGWVVTLCLLLKDGVVAEAAAAMFTFNRELVGMSKLTGAARSWARAWSDLTPLALPLWLGLVGLVASLRRASVNRMSLAFSVAILIWWVLQVWMALTGPSLSMRYWQATFPPMLWLASAGVFQLENSFQRLGPGHRRPIALALMTLMVVLGRPLFDAYVSGVSESYVAFSNPPTERERLAALGESIAKAVPQGETIFVWAYDAGVYVHANRLPASRFTYPRSDEQMEQILQDLARNKPFALLMPQDDSPEFEAWCDVVEYKARDDLLLGYELGFSSGGYQVWLRKGSPGA